MREYRDAKPGIIQGASVIILGILLVAAVFIYRRWQRLSRSGSGDDTTRPTVETEEMMELVELPSRQTV